MYQEKFKKAIAQRFLNLKPCPELALSAVERVKGSKPIAQQKSGIVLRSVAQYNFILALILIPVFLYVRSPFD